MLGRRLHRPRLCHRPVGPSTGGPHGHQQMRRRRRLPRQHQRRRNKCAGFGSGPQQMRRRRRLPPGRGRTLQGASTNAGRRAHSRRPHCQTQRVHLGRGVHYTRRSLLVGLMRPINRVGRRTLGSASHSLGRDSGWRGMVVRSVHGQGAGGHGGWRVGAGGGPLGRYVHGGPRLPTRHRRRPCHRPRCAGPGTAGG